MRKLIFVFILFAVAGTQASENLIYKGVVYDKEGKEKKWTYERYQRVEGNAIFDRAIYKNMEGKVDTEEKMHTVDGKLVRYDMSQNQIKQEAWIEVKDAEVTFNLKKYRKRNYPQTSKLPPNFVVGLSLVPMMQAHWDKLNKGEEVEINLGVWHRQEAIEFKLSRESSNDQELVVKMNPASMFIRAVVDPIYFTFDKTTRDLTQYKGRTTPKEQRGRSYYDYDGLVKYEAVSKTEPGAPDKAGPKKSETTKKN